MVQDKVFTKRGRRGRETERRGERDRETEREEGRETDRGK